MMVVVLVFLHVLLVLRKKVDAVNAHKTEILVLNVRMEQGVRLLDSYIYQVKQVLLVTANVRMTIGMDWQMFVMPVTLIA
jgi:hypothetical protein